MAGEVVGSRAGVVEVRAQLALDIIHHRWIDKAVDHDAPGVVDRASDRVDISVTVEHRNEHRASMASMRVTLPSGTAAELARPADGDPIRGVVLLPDIMGLRPLFDNLASRLADEHGWAVIEPEPFPGRESMPQEERITSMLSFDHDRHVADAIEAADALGVEPVAVTGFCMGGMGAIRATSTGRFDRAAAFYGMIRLPDAWKAAGQLDAIDQLLAAPGCAERVLAVIGTADPYTPAVDVDALAAAGATIVRYDGAEHGFVHDASRPTHRVNDAADAWWRVVAWFRA